MDNTSLLKLALLLSMVGLFILCIIASYTTPPLVAISEVEDFTGRVVEVHGVVSSIRSTPKTTFISVAENENKIDIVAFGTFTQKLTKGEQISVVGKVERYEGEPEIIAEEVTFL